MYRKHFVSAGSGSSLAAPFIELCLSRAEPDRMVGILAPASFQKRKYGKKLVEEVLAHVDVKRVIDTSGAYIPGHAAPTLILVARNRKPASQSDPVRLVLGRRSEPYIPINPERGRVWSAIVNHHDEPGYQDRYISVEERPRVVLQHHPWTLIAGEPHELRDGFERGTALERVAGCIATGGASGLDDVLVQRRDVVERLGLEQRHIRPLVSGSAIADWSVDTQVAAVLPQAQAGESLNLAGNSRWWRFLWPYRRVLEQRATGTGWQPRAWWAWLKAPKTAARYAIVGRSVARWNQFAPHPGHPVTRDVVSIRLQDGACEDDMYALLGYLNSSSACFWLKNRGFAKSFTQSGPEANRWPDEVYEFPVSLLKQMPIPAPVLSPGHRIYAEVVALARGLCQVAAQRAECAPAQVLNRWTGDSRRSLVRALADARLRELRLMQRMVCDQEELDWLVYQALGLVSELAPVENGRARPDERPNEWLSEQPPASLEQPLAEHWAARRKLIRANSAVALIERGRYKRPFRDRTDEERTRRLDAACEAWLVARLERVFRTMTTPRCTTVAGLVAHLERDTQAGAVCAVSGQEQSLIRWVERLLQMHTVPFLASHRLRASGEDKRKIWEQTWTLQHRHDAGEVLDVPVPPLYSRRDYRDATTWRLRGKLDVDREPFIGYRLQGQPMRYGWAGWSHEQRVAALVALIRELVADGVEDSATLRPLLAGLAELEPWLDITSPEYEQLRNLDVLDFHPAETSYTFGLNSRSSQEYDDHET